MIEQQLPAKEPIRHPLPPLLIHDLRAPLNLIIGYSDLLVEQAREGMQDNFVPDLEKVHSAGQRMLGIIEENFIATQESACAIEYELAGAGQRVEEGRSDSPEGMLLVVDDDEGNRDVLSRRLEKLGYAVANAANGKQALEMLSTDTYELVLLDIMMPEWDGYEVLRQLKANEALRHIPVIMISALNEMESVAKCIEMGAEDYLPKPFNPTLLKARVGACLGKKRSRDREMQLFEEVQQNYKRLQELEALRDDLTNMIVHDLRTPLTAIMTAMQTLDVVGEVNSGQREVLTIAVDSADSLLWKINSLLDVEKLESGNMVLDLSLVSLPELIEAAVNQVLPLSKAKDLELIQEIAPDLPWLYADEGTLERILVNLIGNAIKFTSRGGKVTLQVHAGPEGKSVDFSVHDTGEGIPAEAHQRIFEKFGQVESRTGGRKMSTGLGLTFCKLAVEAHGGHIEVESVIGEGSTFSFSIPLTTPATAGE
jgi:signal transduction histidine kinase